MTDFDLSEYVNNELAIFLFGFEVPRELAEELLRATDFYWEIDGPITIDYFELVDFYHVEARKIVSDEVLLLISVIVNVDCYLDLFNPRSDAYAAAESGIYIAEWNWNETYVSAQHKVPAMLSFDIILEFEGSDVLSVEIGEIRPID